MAEDRVDPIAKGGARSLDLRNHATVRLGPKGDAPPAACSHAPGRQFPDRLVREMLRACGIVTCDRCGEALRILGRQR